MSTANTNASPERPLTAPPAARAGEQRP